MYKNHKFRNILTTLLISYFFQDGSECFLPIISEDEKNKRIEFALFKEQSPLTKNRFGIPEPSLPKIIDLNKLDIIFLPCVCFDSSGNRIGMGGGFYDKTLSYLSKKEKTKLIILNSPNNPCGSVMDPSDIKRIADIAKEKDILILTDEVYKDLYFEGSHTSVYDFEGMEDNVVILDGFSKSYAMTGWRLGYGIFPNKLVEPISRLVTNSVSCTSAFSQKAAAAAIQGPQDSVKMMLKEFKERSKIVVDGFNAINGISCIQPKGAFYAFPNIKDTGYKSQELSDALLNQGVAVLPGTSFGKYGEGYLRISFANSRENLNKALKIIKEFLD